MIIGAGYIIAQRFGDILDGKRTWQREINFSNVRHALPDAVAGDITATMPYKAMLKHHQLDSGDGEGGF